MAETYALKEGIRLVQQIGCSNFIMQSDCMELVETVKEGDFQALAAAPILEECYNTLKEFPMAMIEHCDSK